MLTKLFVLLYQTKLKYALPIVACAGIFPLIPWHSCHVKAYVSARRFIHYSSFSLEFSTRCLATVNIGMRQKMRNCGTDGKELGAADEKIPTKQKKKKTMMMIPLCPGVFSCRKGMKC